VGEAETLSTEQGNAQPSRGERDERRREAYERRCREAFQLRSAGATYEQIAGQLGYANRGGAAKAVAHARKEARALTEDVVALELDRFDTAVRGLMPKVLQGAPAAVNALVRVSQARTALLGLDPAKRLELISTDALSAELERLNAELERYDP
jgi:hypothetical protein